MMLIYSAIEGLMKSKFRNAGQTCVCTNRVFVHKKIYDSFEKKLLVKVEELSKKMGNGFDTSAAIGPLINKQSYDKVSALVESAIAQGAKVLHGGKRRNSFDGYFYEPTIVTEVSENMNICQEEIFGPVITLCKFEDEKEVIEMSNNSNVGLANYFYSRDIGRCIRVAKELESGMVGINTGIISNAQAPFGGVKESGIGREGSIIGMSDYMECKYICIGEINK